MDNEWNPRLHAAYAAAQDRFCLVLTELSFDDQFSAIIQYNGNLSQPWARTDVSREVTGITGFDRSSDPRGRYAAVSSEGNFYVLGSETQTEKILGAGILSSDSSGAGSLTDLTRCNDQLWAFGQSGEVYRKIGGQAWQQIRFTPSPPQGFKRIDLGPASVVSREDMYVCGVLNPMRVDIDSATEQRLIATNADNAAWEAALDEAKRKMPNLPVSDEGRVYHWDGNSFLEINLPVASNVLFRSAFVEAPDRIWICGTEGTLLTGSAQGGFRRSGRFSEDLQFISISKYRGVYVLVSEDSIIGFDGSDLRPFEPPFHNAPLRPLKVQAVDDVLYYFDYRAGAFLYDGSQWQQIKAPKSLYARRFKGLR